MKKAGWYLLAGSLICAFFCDIFFGLIGGAIGTEAEDWYSSIGCIIGFIAPSIVYFGNKI